MPEMQLFQSYVFNFLVVISLGEQDFFNILDHLIQGHWIVFIPKHAGFD